MKIVTFKVSRDCSAEIEKLAKELGVTKSYILRSALAKYFKLLNIR